ncbi:EAL domain-containing protein [Novosphingobium sp. KCTC 2891]|uniref:putative bifunctional diguanylate cyclase/phosphodiesterase n=1 Tax=Novosphingobium sp. KCTC 2891 TaxID=2989730 RepID=UPI002221E28A|nr:EAL domain-containing protein [Novosphingobium sp. KCTC 2891]MCW1382137.1 EAL domain-containing protein [Novosphingobium sp. KCTC 2891]
MRSESANYREAVALADTARHLSDKVAAFRLASMALIVPRSRAEAEAARDRLTDAAIGIANAANVIASARGAPSRAARDQELLDHLDLISAPALAVPTGQSMPLRTRALIERSNDRLAGAAAAIDRSISARRDGAYANLNRLIGGWYIMVGLSGALVAILVVGICFDLLCNILPALRQVHGALRRLADGDLDVRIAPSRLREINDLATALETFRVNARAVSGLAFSDPASNLPNRRAFMDRLDAVLAEDREDDCMVMLVDVDRFKYINDDYGHAVGDCLIALIGKRIHTVLGEDSFVARLGGDEFAVLVMRRRGDSPTEIAGRVVGAVAAEPFTCGKCTVGVTLSIGYVTAHRDPAHGWVPATAPDVLLRADLALYASKHNGRNGATAFRESLLVDHEIERALERDLAQALRGDELRMVFQPIHPVAGIPREVEALVRWEHPVHGAVPPARFIPAAERSGNMTELGNWIIERSLSDLSRWPGLRLSLNLSPLQLQQEGFVGRLLDACRRHDIEPRRLCLEVTESISIERNRRALLALEFLRQSGCRIALDDFGTGYSSLSLLRGFRFDRLKLDRELIVDLAHDETSRAVFEAAVTMALRIGAEVVAEGISDAALLAPARAAGCTHLQGYHFSRPLEAGDVPGYFEAFEEVCARVA